MTLINWTDELKRGIAFQDQDHEEAVAVMNALHGCAEADLAPLFKKLFDHTKAHLAREDELMDRIGFFAAAVHKGEHARVLAEMQEFQDKLDAGDIDAVRTYVEQTVPDWFLNHLDSMDTATAMFARQMGET
ncbi:hemerythrin family protein [Magnetovibrio sp.]|uniref:bacteriohemerythrin n=1 Tax=Magnetovibrio sp. TaxID=2024836 RepID=UPI002F91E877